jgi:hypothetical protein
MDKYENLPKSQQVDGDALADQSCVADLIKICPTLEFSSTTPFKKELLAQLVKQSSLNNTKMRGDLWATHRADRILTVCYHMRKVKRGPFELQRLAGSTSGHQLEKLKQMVDDMAMPLTNDILPISASKASVVSGLEDQMEDPIGAAEAEVASPKDQHSAQESTLFQDLYPEANAKSTPAKKSATPKVSPAKVTIAKKAKDDEAAQLAKPVYRKEYYKATNSFGFKRHCKGCKPKQIFSLSSKTLSMEDLGTLAAKVLGSLNALVNPSEPEERRIWLLAKFKQGKLEQYIQ